MYVTVESYEDGTLPSVIAHERGHNACLQHVSTPKCALMQGTVPLRLRSLAVAVHLFIANLIGLGLGPVLVGGLSDWLQPRYGLQAIRYTMLLAAITNVVACVFYLRSARTVEDDLISR